MPKFRVAVDIGGTFTDVAALDEATGSLDVYKTPTTPKNFVDGFINGVKKSQVPGPSVTYFIHGTTVATNSVIQRALPVTALLTTKGFRDIIEIMRGNRPVWGLYDIRYRKPPPIIPRQLRFEVTERVDYRGRVVRKLDENELSSAIQAMKARQIKSLAICFLFANLNPEHERRAAELVSRAMPNLTISLSSEVNPELREYERTSTVAIDASVKPVVSEYLRQLEQSLSKLNFNCPIMIMKSSGGIMSSGAARNTPIHTIESGPAGGVIGAANLANELQEDKVLAIDMGGTTFKVSVIENGRPRLRNEGEIEWGIPYRIPMIDLSEIGAGGGSIGWIDRGGILRVGPQSAGADPGPVCYGFGGMEPTFTDASLVLGRIDPDYFLGGEMKLETKAARDSIRQRIADQLGMDEIEAAGGIVKIAEANMLGSMRVSSVQRGYDPREFVTVAYGGAGPLVAASLANELGSKLVIIPPHPGIFSAIGMLYADMRLDRSASFLGRMDSVDLGKMESEYRLLESSASDGLRQEKYAGQIQVFRYADMRYVGQNYEVTTPIPSGSLSDPSRTQIVNNFNVEHSRLYSHSKPDEPVEVLTLRVTALGSVRKPAPAVLPKERDMAKAARGKRSIFFHETNRFEESQVYYRDQLGAGSELSGPAVIEEMDSTVLVGPRQTASVDGFGNIVIRVT